METNPELYLILFFILRLAVFMAVLGICGLLYGLVAIVIGIIQTLEEG